LTGVTVLSTLHANDTASTIDVFREFGVPPMFIADSLVAIISQRLVRKACPRCRQSQRPDAAEAEFLGLDSEQAAKTEILRGAGCEQCFHTGYMGRTGVFEVMTMDDALRDAVLKGRSHAQLLDLARGKGMQTLESSAKKKVLDKVTTIEEIHRVLTAFSS
jgi:type II secretory ATPase GspE/PulE/Tfp pilus assembly ATPase PilB-like protein